LRKESCPSFSALLFSEEIVFFSHSKSTATAKFGRALVQSHVNRTQDWQTGGVERKRETQTKLSWFGYWVATLAGT
jgi:hypothetical protein